MKRLALMSLLSFLLPLASMAEPGGACRSFIEENCKGQHPGECLRENRDKLPADCKKDMESRHGRPGGPPPLKECQADLPKCEDAGRGPKHMECLAEKGSAECKAKIKEMRDKFGKGRP